MKCPAQRKHSEASIPFSVKHLCFYKSGYINAGIQVKVLFSKGGTPNSGLPASGPVLYVL